MNKIFANTFLDSLMASAAESPRLRMNHVFEAKDGAYRGREYQLMDLPDFCFAGVGIFVIHWQFFIFVSLI